MLQDLCKELVLAKQRLATLKGYVLKLESDILLKIPPKFEGSQSIPVDGYKLTTTHKITRELDYDAYQALELPESMEFVTLKPAIDLFKLRAIERLDPELVAKCITMKPAKTSIKIEEVDE